MSKLTTSTYKREATFTSSIAFLPAVISTAFLLLAVGSLYFESLPLALAIERRLPSLLVPQEDNARLILSTIASGIISLTVFSFSMVMIVLSQASSNQSPRVIPGLTTVKYHQVVLGFYIGTIIYTLLLLLNFKTENGGGEDDVPAIAILLAMTFAVVCLVLFVYFIHSISKAIQVDNIINSVFRKAKNALSRENELANRTKSSEVEQVRALTYTLKNDGNGYLKRIQLTELKQLAKEHDLQLEILVEVGAFTVEGTPLMRLSSDPKEHAELTQQLQDCFDLSEEEVIMEDYEQGVKQISEVAVKALSPGINDPGTALKAIDFLTLLFIYRVQSEERNCLLDAENNLRVIEKKITLDELLHRYLSPIRTYGKGDLQINIRLLRCLYNLLHQSPYNAHEEVIAKHALAVVYDADKNIENLIDRGRLNEAITTFNAIAPPRYQLHLLDVEDVFC
ncbi:DUF2254 domain-containing protein [Pontibacter diazotrophicus]|uniref:DUF2254 domain-containing protein n=1 Tax=Pontibacter diazotrophicus TaxID=1400979 RepID=A0A3D8LBW4_9BACT|nr:DUF2254 domain-containing protein [Pontibacter diazotrophicus]RDV14931.1 DUF2254 domain-containing protein [Pontibacter diazotrophicus]